MTAERSPTGFRNSSRRMWTEEECRAMLNAALLYLAHKAGGQLIIPADEMMAIVNAQKHPGVAMALSDDDKILTIQANIAS